MYKPIPFNPLYAQRSKLEIFIKSMIIKHFPDLKVITNDRKTIGLELDLYFPDLNFAIEINGPVHYDPIFGEATLLQTQANDNAKKLSCKEADINLVIVDNLKKFHNKFANIKWLEVKAILNKHL